MFIVTSVFTLISSLVKPLQPMRYWDFNKKTTVRAEVALIHNGVIALSAQTMCTSWVKVIHAIPTQYATNLLDDEQYSATSNNLSKWILHGLIALVDQPCATNTVNLPGMQGQ